MAAEQKYFESDAANAAWDMMEARRATLQLSRYRKDITFYQNESYLTMENAYALWKRAPTEITWKQVMNACDMYVEEEEPILFEMIVLSRGSPSRKEQVYAHYRQEIRHYHDLFLTRRLTHEKQIIQQKLNEQKQREQLAKTQARLQLVKANQAAKEMRWRFMAQRREFYRSIFDSKEDEYRAVMDD